MDVVVVESPAKAKTINKYLGSGYKVLASYGHVRDLPAKDGSVRPDEGFAMDWSTAERGESHIRDIAKALKDADGLILATDPDREGEAISWHVLELLKQRGVLKGKSVHRVVFHEITKNAILDAMKHPRELDRPLIDAYLARRALDYLVGFTLSPVLWRKLPGSRSAGRVQSVALRLICEREGEIEAFVPREYWSVDVELAKTDGATFMARLVELGGKKLDKFGLANEAAAKAAVETLNRGAFSVKKIERRQTRRHPSPPFTTSTLQQEASRKLGLSALNTMRIAQHLYEGVDVDGETVGLITYMRTDSVTLSGEAIGSARRLLERDYKDCLPDAPRTYKSSAKNAQEAHEAIRPTDMFRRPEQMRGLKEDERRVYELIWKRTLASQMESAILDQVAVDIGGDGAGLRATGSVVAFDGFLRLYQESRDEETEKTDPTAEDSERRLPPLSEGEALARRNVVPEQHFTQPPPRYSEASLVKKLEELGIGRPSTYASILSVLQERKYVRLEKRRFIPEDRGRIVTTFLENFFERYVQYNFTAKLEDLLDDISEGKVDWRQVLTDFWTDFSKAVDGTKDLTITQVIDALDEALGPHFFPDKGDGSNPRLCPGCGTGRLGLKLGKFGAFIGCSNYPECRYTTRLTVDATSPEAQAAAAGPVALGTDPATGHAVTLRKGPYGLYVQLGEAVDKEKPKRVGLPRGWSPSELDLDKAVKLLSLPREIGKHPETGQPIKAGIGRFGPYIQHERTYASIPADEDVLTIGINRAVDLIKTKAERAAQSKLKDLGAHPDGKEVSLYKGRFGPYLKHGRTVATLPKGTDPETLTLDAAVALVNERAAKGKAAGKTAKGKKANNAAATDTEAAPKPKKRAASKSRKPATASTAIEDEESSAPKRRRAKAVGEA